MPTASTATDTWHHLNRVTRPATLTQRCQKSSSPRSGGGDSPHAVGKYRRLRRGWGSPELATPHSLGEGDSSPNSGEAPSELVFPTQWGSTAGTPVPHAVGKYRRLRRGWGSP